MRKLIFILTTFLALCAAQAQEGGAAHLALSRTGHDFGDIARRGGDVQAAFEVTNDGTVPLVITRIVTSCSCLKASYSKRPVPPGEKTLICLTYEPHKAEAGTFHKVVQVYSNSSGGRELITLQGNSIDKQKRD